MPTVNLSQGHNLYYLDYNPPGKPPVLLLHGLGVTGESWQLQIPTLTGVGFRVLAPDARGFGRSSFPGRTSIALMAEDMARLLEQLEAWPAHIVGISMGGASALQLALDHPQLVDRLVLVNTFACLRPERPSVWLYFAVRFILVHVLGLPFQARIVARRLFPKRDQEMLRQILIDQVTRVDPRCYRAAMRTLVRFDVRRRLNEIRVPTLVVTGDRDSTVPPKIQQFLAKNIKGACQVIIPDAGHAVIVDQAGAFNQALLDFLLIANR